MAEITAESIRNLQKQGKFNQAGIGLGKFINNINGTTVNNEFNSAEARLNREFQAQQADIDRYRADTSYQRAVKDMESAGLNPAMMYGSATAEAIGAGQPNGSSASATPGNGVAQIASLVSSASQVLNARSNAYNSKISAGKLILSAVKLMASL